MRFEERMTKYEKFVFQQAKEEGKGVSGSLANGVVSSNVGVLLTTGVDGVGLRASFRELFG